MTAIQPNTPENENAEGIIKPRRMEFDMDQLQEKYFFRGNPILSAFLYSLSAAFPDGERFFIHAIRHYQKDITDPVLSQQIRGFIGQEAHHGNVHDGFNERAESLGLVMGRIQRRFKKRLDIGKKRFSPSQQLAVTAAIEHITATLAQWVLENPDAGLDSDAGNSPLREMLIWHAMEEIEHKAVAFDVYRAAVDNEKQRIQIAKFIFRSFWIQIAIGQMTLLWHERKIPSWKHIREAWDFMWGENGIRRWAAPEFARYLEPGFHPNDIDQSHLIENWNSNYPEISALQVG